MHSENVSPMVMKNKRIRCLKRISFVITIIYVVIVIILSQTDNLFSDIYQNNSFLELSFILFITYLIIYIKDAFLMDYIEIALMKKEKAFIPHLVEHTVEPFLLFILYIPFAWILIQLNIENTIVRNIVTFLLPLLYFLTKKKIIT